MAINWDIWNTGLQNRLNEIGNGQYDWSFITPEVVQGFKKYQAQKKLRIPKTVEAFGKALKEKEKYTDDELFNYAFNKELDKRKAAEKERVYRPDTMIGGTVKPATWEQNKNTSIGDWNTAWTKVPGKWAFNRNDGRKTDEELEKELRREWGELQLPEVEIGSPDSGRIQRSMADGTYPEHVAGEIVTEEPKTEFKAVSEYGFEDVPETDDYSLKTPADVSQWARLGLDKEALREELFKERYGKGYEEDKSIYDAYSKYNPYQRMIEAGKEASYWDPEAGKIFVDAGQRMYDENIKAWEQTRKTAESNRDYALKMYEATDGHPGWLATATMWQNQMVELDKSNPRINGQYFTGLSESDAEKYGNAPKMDDAVSAVWNEVLNGYVTDEETGKRRIMEEGDLENIPGFSELSAMDKDFIRKKARKTLDGFRGEVQARNNAALNTAKTNEALYETWKKNAKDVANGSRVNFEPNAKGGYNYSQAAQAFIYMRDKGVDLDNILEANPVFKELRAELYRDKKFDLKKVGEVALMEAFASLRAKGLWENNAASIMKMAKDLYENDLELRDSYGQQMRNFLTEQGISWRGTQFDPNSMLSINAGLEKENKGGNGGNSGNEAAGDETTSTKKKIKKGDVQIAEGVNAVSSTPGAVADKLSKGKYTEIGENTVNGEKYKVVEITGGSYITTVEIPIDEYGKDSINQAFVVSQVPKGSRGTAAAGKDKKTPVKPDSGYEAD